MFSVWFECKTFRGSFQELENFLEHKQQDHVEEFENTQCIIFEERRIPNNETLTVSFSPTPQEIGETHPHEYIDTDLRVIKIENENFDDRTNSEFQSHRKDQTLNFLEDDYQLSNDQDFLNEADDLISSKNEASATHSVNTCSMSENSKGTNGSCLNKDSCKNSITIFDLEKEADASNNLHANDYISSDLGPTQCFIESQQNPFVLLKRLTCQEIQFWSVKDSEKARTVKYTEKADSFVHAKGKCSEKNLNNVFECKSCLDKFNTDLERTAHANSCILNHANRKDFCAPCNKIFSTIDSLNKHVIRNHLDELKTPESKKFKNCHLCSKKFLYEYDLKRHMLTHSRTNEMQKPLCRPFSSQRCGASFTNKYNLPQHSMRHAAENTSNEQSIDKTYPKISKTKTNDNDRLQLTISDGSGLQKFCCDQPCCEKTFKLKHHLERHMATHSDARPFKCPKPNCKKTFKRKDHLRLHTINVHSDSELIKYPEVSCEKRFTRNGSCPKLAPKNVYKGPFNCPISSCPQKFKHKGSIRLHMLLHSGIRPFECTKADCGQTFQLRHHLTRHLTSHSEASCQKTF